VVEMLEVREGGMVVEVLEKPRRPQRGWAAERVVECMSSTAQRGTSEGEG
jgi:hypothetical protein